MWGRWKERYFVLQPPLLLEYHSAKYAKARKHSNSLLLEEIEICKAEGINGQSFSFALRRKSKETFFLASESEQEMVEWIRLMAPHVRSVNNEWQVDEDELEKEVEAVCVTNENGFFLGANEIFCAMTGYTKEELLGKPCTTIMPPAIAAKHDGYMANYMKTGIKRLIGKPRKLAVKRKDNSLFLCELCLGEVIDKEKSLRRYVVHLRPIIVADKPSSTTTDDASTETVDELSEASDMMDGEDSRSGRVKEKRREAVSSPADLRGDHADKRFSLDKFKKKTRSARSSREASREASSDSEEEEFHSGSRRSVKALDVIEEEGYLGDNVVDDRIVVPYHPLIDKVGRVVEDKADMFKRMIKQGIQDEMTGVLARIDQLESELKDTQRLADLYRLQKTAAVEMILDPENKVMKKIKRAVSSEVKSTDDEKLLFRMDSKATKKVISFMNAVGLEYLEKTLGVIIRRVCEDQLRSYEVNARLIESIDDEKLNRENLLSTGEIFATALINSADAVPPEFCELFKHVKKETEAKWPGKVAYYQPIGGLFFLRFINAALVSPNFFGLIKGEIGFRPQRGLILVSKLLQYIVNGLTFEPSHELYDLNDFVVAQIPAFERFIDKILTIKS